MSSSPGEILRLLVVEDDPRDAELMLEALRADGVNIRADVVDRLEIVRARLDERTYDVIIADYRLRGWRGTEVLQELRQRGLAVPVIMVTGSMGEEFADVCIREGATDFVLKHHLARLPRTVMRAVDTARAGREREAALQQLRDGERRFRDLIDASFDIMMVTEEGVIREVNAGIERYLGHRPEEAIGHRVAEFLPEGLVPSPGAADPEGTYELVALHRDGHPVILEVTARSHVVQGKRGRIMALRDVTEKRALESQLRESQKLEAVARLAGGVAHDFNNLLTVILSEVQLLQQSDRPAEGQLREALEEIESSTRRAASLTRQLLTFSRRDVAEPKVLDPAEVVDGLLKMLRRLIGEDLHFSLKVSPDTGNVRIDRGHLEQVIVNLVLNARDAMPGGGDLGLEVTSVQLDESVRQVQPGAYVMIAVSDTGTGMSEEVQSRIFEPFFTTKPAGKGTGLGLATSYGIVKECGGHIGVYSEPGLGTTMKVYLPRVVEGVTRPMLQVPDERSKSPIHATILVVEDDEAVRRSAVRVLRHLGCEVLAASNAAQAMRTLEGLPRAPELLFTDVVMPDVSGPSLAANAVARFPGLRVLYSTGYTEDMATRLQLVEPGVEVLMKPYAPRELAAKVRSVLGA